VINSIIVNIFNHFVTAAKVEEIERFFEINPPIRNTSRKVEQMVENIRTFDQMLGYIRRSRLVEAAFWS
jgi:hypothetical protein